MAARHRDVYITLSLPCGEQRSHSHMNPWKTASMSLVVSASLGLADDFKTSDGKIYKDATISQVEADGIVIKTKTGISKIYFVELPKEVLGTVSLRFCNTKLERQSRNTSTRSKVPSTSAGCRMPKSLRNESQQSSRSGNRSYRGNTRPARQS